jgi:hypothetical protein
MLGLFIKFLRPQDKAHSLNLQNNSVLCTSIMLHLYTGKNKFKYLLLPKSLDYPR